MRFRLRVSVSVVRCILVTSVAYVSVAVAGAGDWPMYRHDMSRSGVTDESLQTPLHLQWTHVPAHRPRPAWPEPGRELNRLAFDYAPAVVAANGMAYFGSSSDHKVYAIDLVTGALCWSAFTGGPVRFAPVLSGDRVLVPSDDGCLTCLNAADGHQLWQFRGGPADQKILGNEQMMSRWPLRSGVVVDAETVYFAAGMWPSEGVYIYALRVATGDVIWKTVDAGTQYKKQPHPPSEAFLGVAPQGYIVAGDRVLAIPTGRNMPAVYDRQTGRQLHYRSAPRDWGTRWGGSWCQLTGNYLVAWNTHFQPDVEVMPGEFQPDPKDGMWFFEAGTGKELRQLPGKLCAVVKDDVLYASGTGKLSAYDFSAWIKDADPAPAPPPKWQVPLGRTYTLIAAGNTVFAGGVESVTAMRMTDGELLWTGKVEGQARCLAAVDGKLLVGTTTGRIYCFGAAPNATPAVAQAASPPASPIPAATTALTERVLQEAGKSAGYCLVLGAGDGDFLRALAENSDLAIQCAEPDPDQVKAVRAKLDAAGLYGERVVVHFTPEYTLPFPKYFADLIVADPAAGRDVLRWPATDVYRVLHPNGGRAYFTVPKRILGRGTASLRRWLLEGTVPEAEITVRDDTIQVTRSPLAGTDDWTHQYAGPGRAGASADTGARVPLEVLWFGKPEPAIMVARHWRGPAPLFANGRMFVIGQRELACVDAYNGREFWRKDLGTKNGAPVNLARWPVDVAGNSVVVDESSAYITTGKTCLRLDAATGETTMTYQAPDPPFSVPPDTLQAMKWQHLSVENDMVAGSVGEGTVARYLFALDKQTGGVRWNHAVAGSVAINAFALDGSRIYFLDGATPEELANAKRRGQATESPLTLCALDLHTGTMAWQVTKDLTGATDVRVADGVVFVSGRNLIIGVAATTGDVLYTRNTGVGKAPVIVGDTVYIQPYAYDLKSGANRMQVHPFSGEEVPWMFTRSYGCGQISGSPNLLMFRSGTLGFYDLAGDTGTHNFAGMRAGCSTNAIAAGGLLLSAPADASCTCSYSLRTTLALASAERPEGWGLMYTSLPTTSLQNVSFNLGAPGDRRDADGTLWMAAPHPTVYNARPGYANPFEFEFSEGGGPTTFTPADADPQQVAQPWLYTTALCGLRKATFDMTVFPSGYLAWPTSIAPLIDGVASEACWDGYKAISIPAENATLTLRQDNKNLYLCYERAAKPDAGGAPTAWRKAITSPDGDIWQGDSFEVLLSPLNKNWREPSRGCLHLGVSASGARFDASWEYADLTLPTLDVPPVQITVDGDAADWRNRGLLLQSLPGPKGKFRPAKNFDAVCRLGWTEEGIAVLVEVTDDIIHEDPNPNELWYGDSIECFFTPQSGTKNYVQIAVSPGVDGTQATARHRFYDQRTNKQPPLGVNVAGRRTETGWRLEMLWPWANIGIKPDAGRTFGMQLFVNDDDSKGRGNWFRSRWHPLEHPSKKPNAFQTLRIASEASPPVAFTRAPQPGPDGLFDAAAPLPFPVTPPPELGAKPEDRAYSGDWRSAVKTTPDSFVAELAIPWGLLADAGAGKGNVMLDVMSRGLLKRPPFKGRGFQPIVIAPEEAAHPRNVSVRLHFAEPEGTKTGARVGDVKLQGTTVLEELDVVKAADGAGRPLVKDIPAFSVTRTLTLGIEPKPGAGAPSITGIQIRTEPE